MKVCVLSGSPKGKYSITLQTVLYLQKRFPDCAFEIIHAGQSIRALERDLAPVLEAVSRADLLLFCYPVYTFAVPSQLHRLIELLGGAGVTAGKLAAQISTSKHFYDTTAHGFIRDACSDLGLLYLGGLSADMEDLLSEKGRAEADGFWKYVLWRADNGVFDAPAPKAASPLPAYERRFEDSPKLPGNETVIVADLRPEDAELSAMIEDFRAVYPFATRLVNIADFPFAGGCLGCFGCAVSGECVYRDGFQELLSGIQTASATVYAFTLRGHSMGSRFKMYDDRQFCNGHRTVTMGAPVGYLVRGDLTSEANLRLIIEGRAEVGGNLLCGAASDADGIARLARTLCYALENNLSLPKSFLGVGGLKVFRDLIWLMRGMMKADHKFYKKHGFYDFPQKRPGTVLKMKLVGALISSPAIKARMGNKMNEGMIAPYQKVLDGAGAIKKR